MGMGAQLGAEVVERPKSVFHDQLFCNHLPDAKHLLEELCGLVLRAPQLLRLLQRPGLQDLPDLQQEKRVIGGLKKRKTDRQRGQVGKPEAVLPVACKTIVNLFAGAVFDDVDSVEL